jgi:hypothetical protein
VLDTLGKLYAHGHGIGGYGRRLFQVSMAVLILERGRDCRTVRMTPPLRCPGCGGREPQYTIIAPSWGGQLR